MNCFSSFYPDPGLILLVLLDLARKWKKKPSLDGVESACWLCFFTMDGSGFLWTVEYVAVSIYSHIKWTRGQLIVGRDFCIKEGGNVQDRFVLATTNWQDGQSNQNKKTSLLTDQHS